MNNRANELYVAGLKNCNVVMAHAERGTFFSSETLKKINKLTLTGALGIAVFGAAFGYPALIGPALGAAALDAGGIVAINKYQDWRKKK